MTRDARTVVSVAALGLVVVVVLALSYATPVGRRLARQGIGTARVVSNVNGDNVPAAVLRVWSNAPESAVRVDVYRSGRLVVSRRDRAEMVFDRAATEKLIASAQLALGDFNARGCETTPDGINADLYLLVDGKRLGSVCRHALDWPQGAWTRRLLTDMREQLPADTLPVKF